LYVDNTMYNGVPGMKLLLQIILGFLIKLCHFLTIWFVSVTSQVRTVRVGIIIKLLFIEILRFKE
jgi:hypothetical protein